MKVPEGKTVYIGGKKFKAGSDLPEGYKPSDKFKKAQEGKKVATTAPTSEGPAKK